MNNIICIFLAAQHELDIRIRGATGVLNKNTDKGYLRSMDTAGPPTAIGGYRGSLYAMTSLLITYHRSQSVEHSCSKQKKLYNRVKIFACEVTVTLVLPEI